MELGHWRYIIGLMADFTKQYNKMRAQQHLIATDQQHSDTQLSQLAKFANRIKFANSYDQQSQFLLITNG